MFSHINDDDPDVPSVSKQIVARLRKSVPECLPANCIDYCFAYGSGVLPQANVQNPGANMIDLFVVLNDSHEWHRVNLATNARHYSLLLRLAGANRNVSYQRRYAARVHCNTMVRLRDKERTYVKYSVIAKDDFLDDLIDWRTLYAAGRLHKPVVDIVRPSTSSTPQELQNALSLNRASAYHTALLLLPESFTQSALFTAIAMLSYGGDIRTVLGGEDKKKVSNIVDANMDAFARIYEPLIRNDAAIEHQIARSSPRPSYVQDQSPAVIQYRLEVLPKCVQRNLQLAWNARQRRKLDIEDVVFALSKQDNFSSWVDGAVTRIVRASSTRQTLKNIISAGITKSVLYAGRKVIKGLKSLR